MLCRRPENYIKLLGEMVLTAQAMIQTKFLHIVLVVILCLLPDSQCNL